MCRMFECSTRVRLSFSGGPHAPVNMADSMENVGSLTVSGSKEVMELPENLKALQKLDVRNIVQRSKCAISCIFSHRHSLLPYYSPCLQEHVAAREAKPSFGAALVSSVHDYETHYMILICFLL